MSRTLTSPCRQAWSRTSRSSLPSASEATSLGRRNPRKKNRGAFMRRAFLNRVPDVSTPRFKSLDRPKYSRLVLNVALVALVSRGNVGEVRRMNEIEEFRLQKNTQSCSAAKALDQATNASGYAFER